MTLKSNSKLRSPSRLLRARGCVLACAGMLAWAGVANADEPAEPASDAPASPEETAAKLKTEGDRAMDGLRYADAYDKYSAAYAIDPKPALLFNMGRALQAQNELPRALEKLEQFDKEAPEELKARVPGLAKLLQELRAKITTLSVASNVEGAQVFIDKTVVGTTPLVDLKVLSGAVNIEVTKEGYFPYRKQVTLKGGGAQNLDVQLASRADQGLLIVNADVPRADVWVDGKRQGVTPFEAHVPAGTRALSLMHPDRADYETRVVVPAGGEKRLDIEMEGPSVFSRWYFWGGVAVVVAAGAVITVALLTERPADSGTIEPGQIAAPSGLGFSF